MQTRLYRVILPVDDIEKATSFYTDLLGLVGERVSAGRHYFDCGGTILACYDPVADGDGRGGGWRHRSNQYLYFGVGNLDEVFNRASALDCRALGLLTCDTAAYGTQAESRSRGDGTLRTASTGLSPNSR